MKTKFIFTSIILLAFLISIDPAPAWALEGDSVEEEGLPPLYFYALNVGFKDDNSAQNYDFFELRKSGAEDLALDDYSIVYTNSSGNASDPLVFTEGTMLRAEALVFGFAKSPQYSSAPEQYLYNFSSSGLASTSGKLSLFAGEELVDELCWGKTACDKQITKFSDGDSYVLEGDAFVAQKYYPDIVEDAL
jgi:hypothetical protein